MTVLMPKDAYAVLHGDSPVIGNAEEIEAVIDFLASVEEETFRYQGEISQARLDLVHSKSQTTGKLSEKIDVALFPGSMILSDGVIDAKGAFTRYLGEVKDIHRKADDLLSRVTGELETVRTNAREIEVIASAIGVSSNFNWDVGPPKNMPEPTVVVEVSDDPLFS